MTPTEFAKFIDDNKAHQFIESQIVDRVVKALADAGTPVVNVWDSEQDNPVSTPREIDEQVYNLDECWLQTETGAGVFIVLGNEWDALADYNMSLEETLAPVNEWIALHY